MYGTKVRFKHNPRPIVSHKKEERYDIKRNGISA